MDILHIVYILFAVFSALFGIVIGSFLNVVIYRVPAGRTISRGRSMCMSCGHTLGANDLIPLISWAVLKGKCRYCGAPVASRYSKIEGLTGVFFLITALTHLYASLYIFDYSELFFTMSFIYYCFFLAAGAAVIAAMMIYHDTRKGFIGLAVCTCVLGLLSTLVSALRFPPVDTKAVLINVGFGLIYMAGISGLTSLAFMILRKQYKLSDLYVDLTFAGMMLFTDYLCFIKASVLIPFYALIHAVIRVSFKNRKADKYTGIILASLIVIFMLIRYIFIELT